MYNGNEVKDWWKLNRAGQFPRTIEMDWLSFLPAAQFGVERGTDQGTANAISEFRGLLCGCIQKIVDRT